jgi:hypothetical protein
MSFKAGKPFYPYREPEAEQQKAAGEPRLLRVFLAAPGRFAGTLGDGPKPWPGATLWSGPVDAGRWTGVYTHADLTDPPRGKERPPVNLPREAYGYWLTEFEDHSSPRPGTDEVYFEPDLDQSPVARPPRVITSTKVVTVTPAWHAAVLYGVPAALVLGGLAAWRLRRK